MGQMVQPMPAAYGDLPVTYIVEPVAAKVARMDANPPCPSTTALLSISQGTVLVRCVLVVITSTLSLSVMHWSTFTSQFSHVLTLCAEESIQYLMCCIKFQLQG